MANALHTPSVKFPAANQEQYFVKEMYYVKKCSSHVTSLTASKMGLNVGNSFFCILRKVRTFLFIATKLTSSMACGPLIIILYLNVSSVKTNAIVVSKQ